LNRGFLVGRERARERLRLIQLRLDVASFAGYARICNDERTIEKVLVLGTPGLAYL
jgi:hypothetical protein